LLQARGDRSREPAEAEGAQEAEGQQERRPVLRERQARARQGERSRADSDAAPAPEAVHGAADGNLDGGTEEGSAHVDRGDGGSRQIELRHDVVQNESDCAARPEEGHNAPHAQDEPH
jgi:hypothetical protein